jgi:hypothetical protein
VKPTKPIMADVMVDFSNLSLRLKHREKVTSNQLLISKLGLEIRQALKFQNRVGIVEMADKTMKVR